MYYYEYSIGFFVYGLWFFFVYGLLFFVYGFFSLWFMAVSYSTLRAHETKANLVCRLLLEKKKILVILRHLTFIAQ